LDLSLTNALLSKNWIEVERQAKRLWSIEDNPWAATAFWALDRRRGSAAEFGGYVKRLRMKPNQILFFQAVGCLVVGELEPARQSFDLLRQTGAPLHDLDFLQQIFQQAGAFV
jgi:hypothetical protein